MREMSKIVILYFYFPCVAKVFMQSTYNKTLNFKSKLNIMISNKTILQVIQMPSFYHWTIIISRMFVHNLKFTYDSKINFRLLLTVHANIKIYGRNLINSRVVQFAILAQAL